MDSSAGVFEPPFCPFPRCEHHVSPRAWRYHAHGWFERKAEPRRIRRFRCAHCGGTFSTQTFSTSYWLRYPALPRAAFFRLLACSSYRQMAREAGVAHTTFMRLAARLGRHCLLYSESHRPKSLPLEPIAVDGFESFEYSQYHPIHLNLAIGAQSHFIYASTSAELRRKGRMTESQRVRRAQTETTHGRASPKAIEDSMTELIRLAVREPGRIVVLSDEHPAYPRALRRVTERSIDHRTTPGRAARTPNNPLFPVNLADLLLRHGGANHKRETIAFSKRRQGALQRLAVFSVWRNFIKRFSERRGGPTPAMAIGLAKQPQSVDEVLERRLFATRVGLPEPLMRVYRRLVVTRRIPNGREHRLRYAF
jgi:hypothetical protein